MQSPQIRIVLTQPVDWPAVRKDVSAIERLTFEPSMRYSERDGDYESFLNKHSINYVAYDRNMAIGYLMSSRLEDDARNKGNKHYGKFDTIYLDSIAVIPSCQKLGIGKRMFARFVSLSKKRGYKRIVLDATSEGMVRLAEKYGFAKIRFYKNWEGNRNSWLMEKKF